MTQGITRHTWRTSNSWSSCSSLPPAESRKSSVPLDSHFVYSILLWFYIDKPLANYTFTFCSLCALENMSLNWKSPKGDHPKGVSSGFVAMVMLCQHSSRWLSPEVNHTHSLSSDHHHVSLPPGPLEDGGFFFFSPNNGKVIMVMTGRCHYRHFFYLFILKRVSSISIWTWTFYVAKGDFDFEPPASTSWVNRQVPQCQV